MEFIQTIFASALAVFGLGTAQPSPTPVATTPDVAAETEVVAATTSTQNTTTETAPAETAPAETATTETAAADTSMESAMTGPPVDTETVTAEPTAVATNVQTMLVAGGCFWCVEADLEKTPGVIAVVSGYGGGDTANPTYSNYGAGGHREVVEVTYDANQVSFEDILIVTMKTTDPTDDDGTFSDRGDKYSAAFYYETDAQREIIESLIAEVDVNGPYADSLAIDVEQRPTFWRAEDRHQDYYKGTLTKLKYQYYRKASGRDDFINRHWDNTTPNLPWRNETETTSMQNQYPWSDYTKPSDETLKAELDATTYKVTQQDGTERAGTSPLDKIYEPGIYVDVLSGEPLFSSRDKFDSGTGWPSFTQPITSNAVTEHEDRKLFVTRTEIRSAIADNHLGHVFTDGPEDRGGLRYCMNGVALRFVPEAEMETQGYGDFLQYL